jgi:hypothetical protein
MKRDDSVVPPISKARKELLSKYAAAAGFLYGAIGMTAFVNVFNHNEGEKEAEKIDEREASFALKRLSPQRKKRYL